MSPVSTTSSRVVYDALKASGVRLMSDVGGGIRPMKRLEALNAVYDRLHDRIVVTIMGAVAAELQFARSLRL